MKPGNRMLLAALILAVAATHAPADEKLELTDKFATVGTAEAVWLTGATPARAAVLRLRVVYRPNSATSLTKVVGAFDEAGKITWTPEAPGLTVLEAVLPDGQDESGEDRFKVVTKLRVATCYAKTPMSGLLVMILAGILLFGGAAVSLWLALRETPDR